MEIISFLGGELISKKCTNIVSIKCQYNHIFKIKLKSIKKGKWCPYCPKKNESKGERIIRKYLEEKNISFRPQKSFRNLRGKKKLKFDFGYDKKLPKFCIEYDGKQHFEQNSFFNSNLKYDIKKNLYCQQNNISLLRIDYKQNEQNIYQLLDSFFSKINKKNVFMLSNDDLYNFD